MSLSVEQIERAHKFFDSFKAEFEQCLCKLKDADDIVFEIRRFFRNKEVSIYNGCTRIVLVDETDDEFIIKFDIPCQKGFMGHTDDEARIYGEAENEGLSEYFSAVKFLDKLKTFAGVLNIYVGEFCECGSEMIEDSMYEHYSDDTEYYTNGEEEECLDYAQDIWGSEIEEKVYTLICRNGSHTDLHSGNWGIRDGQLVVVDYSGYYPHGHNDDDDEDSSYSD